MTLDDQSHITKVFGREVLAEPPKKQAQFIRAAFEYWRGNGFPYPELSRTEQEADFMHLQGVDVSRVIDGLRVQASTIGLRLANSFHPQMWSVPARRHLRSPIDHFLEDDTLIKLLQRAPRFWPDRRCWNAQCLRSALRIYAGGRVSNFRPVAARAIVSAYSNSGQTVLDFSAGYGGRLLGCLTLNRRYIGIDAARAQISGLQRMVKALKRATTTDVELIRGCAEDVVPLLPAKSVDLVFSSPPYFNVEKYSRESDQSYRRYPDYASWKENFLRPLISASQHVLRNGGYLVLNIANTQRHRLEADFQSMIAGLFAKRHVLRLLMHTRPLQRSVGAHDYRWEPILVLRKGC